VRRDVAAGALAIVLAAASGAAQEPYRSLADRPPEYAGPGREHPDLLPQGEVTLAWFGPGEADHAEGGDFWRGASLALADANRAGGFEGRPFRLLPVWSDNPWAAGVGQLARAVFEGRAVAILAAIDGPSAHLAEQVAAKALLPVVSPGSTDETVNLAGVPWMFSCLPGDERLASAVVPALLRAAEGGPLAVAATTDHDGRAALVAYRRVLAARGVSPALLVEWRGVEAEVGAVAERVLAASPRAVLVLASARGGGRLVAALRERGYAGPVFGGATLGRRLFGEAAGAASEGAVFPLVFEPAVDGDVFAVRYEAAYGHPPDYAAAQSYDAVRLLVEAVRRAGPNRSRVLDAVRALSPWRGVTGEHRWDVLGRNQRPIALGTWKGGRTVPLAARPGEAGRRAVRALPPAQGRAVSAVATRSSEGNVRVTFRVLKAAARSASRFTRAGASSGG